MTNTTGDERDEDGQVRRRRFLAGIGVLGAGGAAGCLGDGDGGSPTPTPTDPGDGSPPSATDPGTTDPPTTSTPTPTPTLPDEPAFDALPADLSYEYHDGEFSAMPAFGGESATESGPADRITADLADGAGALRFAGTLPVGDRLEPGSYTFLTGPELVSEGRLKLSLNGRELALSGETSTIFIDEGDNELVVEYYQPGSGGQISLGWRGTYGELLPPLADTDPERRGKQQYEYELAPRGRCQGKMMQMPNSGSELSQRSIAVALPTFTNYCFDMNTCSVRYAWRGAFLDYGPLSSYGGAAGDENGQPLGLLYDVGAVNYPLRIGDPDAVPDTEYRAYREEPYPAELHYTVDGVDVTQAVEGVFGTLGLRYTVRFDGAPSDPVYFLTAQGEKFDRSASAGTWDGATLEVPAGTEEFTATVVNTRVGR
jgi:hypothetical protein